jgi:hypothetical protein
MKKKIQILLTFSILVVLISSLYVFTDWFSKVTGYFKGEDEIARLTVCLNNKEAEFYGSVFSPESERTKIDFGQEFQSITYIECGKGRDKCPNLISTPAWYINGKIYYGYRDITELINISNCTEN